MEGLDPANLSDREILLLVYEEQKNLSKRVESHGKRLYNLEAWRNVIVGGSIVVAAGWKLLIKEIEQK